MLKIFSSLFYGNSNYDSCVLATIRLVDELAVKGSREVLRKQIENHPQYPSLLSISDTLTDWRISNVAIRITKDLIKDLSFPSIFQIKRNGGNFVVVTNVNDGIINYFDTESRFVTETTDKFDRRFSGVALLVKKNQNSGEPNYAANRRLEILKNLRSSTAYGIIALLLTALCWIWPTFTLPVLLVAAGIGLSIALLKQTLGQETILGQVVCKAGSSTDCNKVINSKMAKVYGDVSLAEITLLFFACALGVQVTSLATGHGYSFLLGWLSLAALPVTVLSIYYQWRVLKTWCLLCLGVVGSIWGLAGFYGYHINDWSYGWPAIQAFAVGVAVPLLVWFLVRTSIVQSARVPSLEKGLNKFQRSLSVFEALSAQKPEIHPEVYAGDVVLGNKEASNSVTIVSNPTCGPCVRAHQFVESWLEEHGENLKVMFRFAANPADTGTSGTVARHVISLGLNSNDQLSAAMHAWYATEKPKLQEWIERFPTESHPEAQDRLAQHSNWCRANQINATPTIFFNGRQIPEEFSLQDFEYFLRLKMAEVEMEMAEA